MSDNESNEPGRGANSNGSVPKPQKRKRLSGLPFRGKPRRGPGKPGKGPSPGSSAEEAKPAKAQSPRTSGPPKPPSPARTGIRLKNLGEGNHELDHPPCVRETELDYEEGMEIWKAGDPEDARDALRFALSACRDNLWVHVALGQIALKEFNDPQLAIGHFGYVIELTTLVVTPRFKGRLVRDRDNNRPVYEALEGLITCYEKQGKPRDAAKYRALRDAWQGRG